jgi:hypothetical protein
MKTDLQGFKHFNSYNELDEHLAKLPEQDEWFVSCNRFGEMRRTKALFKWEKPSETLFVIRAKESDRIYVQDISGKSAEISVLRVPIVNAHTLWYRWKEEAKDRIPILDIQIKKIITFEISKNSINAGATL